MEQQKHSYARSQSKGRWAVIAAIAVALHLAFFVSVQDSHLSIFGKSIDEPSTTATAGGASVDALIALEIEILSDDADAPAVEIPPVEKPPVEEPSNTDSRSENEAEGEGKDLEDLTGDHQSPLPTTSSGTASAVPPRPVEITWPETSQLKHCLGLHIDVRIRVGEDGEIKQVESVQKDYPADCIAAALDAARRIRFVPGHLDGNPKEMWTLIRIGFRGDG